jgi:sporulation protein YlmC with PRC-barrel domain
VEQDTLNRNETHDLISSEKVEGTAVYNRNGDKLGSISHFMVGKRDGRVSYAVMSFGGFMGLGTDEYTLPWEKLEYDTGKGGYVVDVSKEQLDQAPRYDSDNNDYDRNYYDDVSGYYGVPTRNWI